VPGLLLGLSGLAALIDETVWTRTLESLLGHTAPTTATVVAGFMAGLALGAISGAGWAPRLRFPMRAYAVLEVGIAVWALLLPSFVALADRSGLTLLGAAWAAPGPSDSIRWIVGFLAVVFPALAMGATFPLVVEASARRNGDMSLSRRIGSLYAANTAGAAVGTVLAGFILIRHLGLHATLTVGAITSLAAAVLAFITILRTSPRPSSNLDVPAKPVSRPSTILLALLMASGFTSLSLEILWLRLFVFPLGSNILAFSTVVATLVLTIAAGSWVGGILGIRVQGAAGLAFVEMGLALSAVGSLVGFAHFRGLLTALVRVLPEKISLGTLGGRVLVVLLLIGASGIFMGAVLPLAAAWDRKTGEPEMLAGTSSGWLYGALTVGNIVGALAAGYLIIPLLSITHGVFLAAGVSIVVASVAAYRPWGSRGSATMATVGSIVLVLASLSLGGSAVAGVAASRDPHARLLAVLEGIQGTVTVSEVPPLPVMMDNRPFDTIGPIGLGYRLIAVDAVQVAGTAPDLRTTQKLQAHVPLLLHPDPHNVLQIGYGSGETTREAALHGLNQLDVIELNPDVVRMARRFFPEFSSEGFTTVFTDAKLAVRTSSRRWDVILNDSTYPGMAGSSQLYSLDHFRACRAHLAPGGIVSTWLPVDLPPETFRIVLSTFSTIFPNCSYWLMPNCLNKHGVLVGSPDPDVPLILRPETTWAPGVSRSLEELGVSDATVLAAARLLDARAIATLAGTAPVNSDDRPILEYPVRGVRISGNDFWDNTLRLILSKARPTTHVEAVRLLLQGQAELLAGSPNRALRLYGKAQRAWPQSSWPGNLIQGILIQRAQRAFVAAMEALQEGRKSGAEQALQDCVQLAPDAAACQQELGRLLLWSGRSAAAIPHLEAARRHATDTSMATLELGDAFRLTDQPARAEALYREYLASHKPTFDVLAALAEAVASQRRLQEAERLALQALALDPGRPEGRRLLQSIRASLVERAGG